jgi:hypothetical protein
MTKEVEVPTLDAGPRGPAGVTIPAPGTVTPVDRIAAIPEAMAA